MAITLTDEQAALITGYLEDALEETTEWFVETDAERTEQQAEQDQLIGLMTILGSPRERLELMANFYTTDGRDS